VPVFTGRRDHDRFLIAVALEVVLIEPIEIWREIGGAIGSFVDPSAELFLTDWLGFRGLSSRWDKATKMTASAL
jgi:hypothetical protein